MEIKSIKELSDSIELQLGGSLNIKKETIAEWYEKYCKEDPQPQPEPEPVTGRLSFQDFIDKFNQVLTSRGYTAITSNLKVSDYLGWAFDFTNRQYDSDVWIFKPETYPLVYDYRGTDTSDDGTAYNALHAWLMASILSELVPDSGATTNTQTELFKLAYEIGGGRSYPLYNNKAFKADPYSMREVAGVMYAICRGDSNIESMIDTYRDELGGKPIQASNWDELDYRNTTLYDEEGRKGYSMDYLGYCVNTELFLPDAPGPRIPTTTVCELPYPWQEGQPISQFNMETSNYDVDEMANQFFVDEYNMMSMTPLSVWNSYSLKKKNRMINVAAIPPCTFLYMFGKKNIKFDGIINKSYDGQITADYYCFSQTPEDTGLVLDGPFSDLQGMYHFNGTGIREKWLGDVATIIDCFRFPTEDPNYGRCRPGCRSTRQGGELNPIHGANENEIYNVDICTMVADDSESKAKYATQDGFAADSPRSYVSGHSAQIWGLALMFTQMDNGNDNVENWIRKSYEYSVNRSIGRFHWNSDCVYGRLFGSLALPIINAMIGLKGGLEAVKNYIRNPKPEGDWSVKLIIENTTSNPIYSTGEIRLYVDNHIGVNTYLPGAESTAGALYTFNPGENNFSDLDVHCVLNGEDYMDDSYNGQAITEVRFYDQRHYNNVDAGFNFTLDTSDPRCDTVLNKAGATYVLKIS